MGIHTAFSVRVATHVTIDQTKTNQVNLTSELTG